MTFEELTDSLTINNRGNYEQEHKVLSTLLLIFSYRFEKVQANSEKLWRYWRYAVIMDYRTRVPAPLNLVIRPVILINKCIKKCNALCCKKSPKGKTWILR